MSNAIAADYMASPYGNSVKRQEAKGGQAEATSFRDQVAEKAESVVDRYKREHPEDASHVNAQVRAGKDVRAKYGADQISGEDMTMEEYKGFVYRLLNCIPFHSTRIYDREMVSISDAGWEQMKKDPDYEAWVLGYTLENRSVRNPFFGLPGASGNVYAEHFGASIEEHIGQSVGPSGPGSSSSRVKNEKSWWEKRHEKMKERMEEQKKTALEKARARRKLEQEIYLNSRLASQQRLRGFLMDGTRDADLMHLQSTGISAFAAMAYENNISIFSNGLFKSNF